MRRANLGGGSKSSSRGFPRFREMIGFSQTAGGQPADGGVCLGVLVKMISRCCRSVVKSLNSEEKAGTTRLSCLNSLA